MDVCLANAYLCSIQTNTIMRAKTLVCRACLWVIVALLFSACKEENAELRFYEDSYEVATGRIRYLGIESGNGDYTLEVANPSIAAAGVEHGWTALPDGNAIYVKGMLTGSTSLTVTDNATGESRVLPIKVTDYYETLRQDDTGLYFFLVNNEAHGLYVFTRGEATVSDNGLRLAATGRYDITREGDDYYLSFRYAGVDGGEEVSGRYLATEIHPYLLHRLDEKLDLHLGTSAYTGEYLEYASIAVIDTATGEEGAFSLEELEMPKGILP